MYIFPNTGFMKNFTFTKEHVKDGKIDHVDIGDATVVTARCIGLKEIPCWENVEEVYCEHNYLTELPLWPKVKIVVYMYNKLASLSLQFQPC
jgi:hypothetical protein